MLRIGPAEIRVSSALAELYDPPYVYEAQTPLIVDRVKDEQYTLIHAYFTVYFTCLHLMTYIWP